MASIANTPRGARGFTLPELAIVIVIIGILASIAYSSFNRYIMRSSRQAAQTELLELANLQEKIYLNANAYTTNLTAAYTGQAGGGLGEATGTTNDGKYALSLACNPNPPPATGCQAFVLTATPNGGQTADGNLTLDEKGSKTWNGNTYWK